VIRFVAARVTKGYSGGPIINSCRQIVAMTTDGDFDHKIALNISKVVDALLEASRQFSLPKLKIILEKQSFCPNPDPTSYRVQDQNIRATFAVRIPSYVPFVKSYGRRLEGIYADMRNPLRRNLDYDPTQVYRYAPILPGSSLFFDGTASQGEALALETINNTVIHVYCYDARTKKDIFAGTYKGQLLPPSQLSISLTPRLSGATGQNSSWAFDPLEKIYLIW
jgi:hypothetical protein